MPLALFSFLKIALALWGLLWVHTNFRIVSLCFFVFVLFFFNCVNVCLFLRERQSMSGGGAERAGDKNPKQAPGSELSAQSLTQGSNP